MHKICLEKMLSKSLVLTFSMTISFWSFQPHSSFISGLLCGDNISNWLLICDNLYKNIGNFDCSNRCKAKLQMIMSYFLSSNAPFMMSSNEIFSHFVLLSVS